MTDARTANAPYLSSRSLNSVRSATKSVKPDISSASELGAPAADDPDANNAAVHNALAPAHAFEPHNPSFPWSEDRARGIARTVAKRKAPMFSAWPDIELDDLITESSLAIRKAHSKFNPDYRTLSGKRMAYSTFAYSVAARRLFDIWRARSRRTTGETAYRESLTARHGPRSLQFDRSPLKTKPTPNV